MFLCWSTPSNFSFNPRPRRGAGATAHHRQTGLGTQCFNPRPRRGAGATQFPDLSRVRNCRFNPRPRRGAGATPWPSCRAPLSPVSILARAEARALLGTVAGLLNLVPFQSSPAPRRGRYLAPIAALQGAAFQFQSSPAPRRGRYCPAPVGTVAGSEFQSSPAPRRGRYGFPMLPALNDSCFNPRPRRGAGATRKVG